MDKNRQEKGSFIALLPFIIFIVAYLGVGLYLTSKNVEMAFYQFKAPVAVILGIVAAFLLTKGSIDEKFDTFIKGCGDDNIIIMCIIYILAGAFSVVSKEMGGVDSTVNLGLTIIPPSLITVGIFILAAFISLSTGTSVGTIAALGSIAVGFAEKTGVSMPLMLAALIGGAMFGDNLSVISDTTIAATRTQGVSMKDKFKNNLAMAIPAMIVSVVLLIIFGKPDAAVAAQKIGDYNIIKIIPYLFVLISAIAGMNVFLVLLSGTVLSGIIGVATGAFDLLKFSTLTYDGFAGMFEIFLLSLLTGGLAALVAKGGGLTWLTSKLKGFIKGRKSAEVSIAAMTALTDAATANNTVAIIIDGPIARNICEEYKVDPRRSASLLDTFGAVMQGFIPYGAQILIACGFAKGVSPFDVMPLLWYQMALAFFAILSIFVPFADGYIRKHPWDFEKWAPVGEANDNNSDNIKA